MERRSKCIFVMSLVWTILMKLFSPSMLFSSTHWNHSEKRWYLNILIPFTIFFYILLPFFGLLANKLGQLNTAIACTCIGTFLTFCFIILSLLNGMVIDTIVSVVVPLSLFTRVYFENLVLCFISNELTEQSCKSDDFSTYVWWYVWGSNFGAIITETSSCLFKSHKYFQTCASSIHLVFLIVVIISSLLIKKWTVRYNYSVNPFKLIFGVLCFAVKNKHPLKRSALTYWEEAEPSRINLGKEKYGGPFLEKDVESVKTFFRLIPLIAVTLMIFFPYQTLGRLSSKQLSHEECLLFGTYVVLYAVMIVIIPVYQLIIKPYCMCHRIKMSILKRTGIGIALTVLAKFGYVALNLSISVPAYVNYNETICLLESPTNGTGYHDIFMDKSYSYYHMIPSCINSFGVLLVKVGSLEFIYAQTPHSMHGLLIGLWLSISGTYEIAGWMMIKPFKAAREYLIPSCQLYILIMNFIFMVVSLIVFVLLSRRYKLHRYEDVFNAHDIAEAYYENEFNQREKNNNYGSISGSLNFS